MRTKDDTALICATVMVAATLVLGGLGVGGGFAWWSCFALSVAWLVVAMLGQR